MDKRKNQNISLALLISFLLFAGVYYEVYGQLKEIKLPKPAYSSKFSVEEAIYQRRSVRSYKKEPLTLKQVSQLLWAAGGLTIDGVSGATRAYPSAGARYPLEIYLAAGDVEGLTPGLYRYEATQHKIILVKEGDLRKELANAALGQGMIVNAPVSIIFLADFSRTTRRYGERGKRYVYMDVGHAGQNVHLQAESLGLGTVVIGAFRDEEVKKVLGIADLEPLYIMPIGKK